MNTKQICTTSTTQIRGNFTEAILSNSFQTNIPSRTCLPWMIFRILSFDVSIRKKIHEFINQIHPDHRLQYIRSTNNFCLRCLLRLVYLQSNAKSKSQETRQLDSELKLEIQNNTTNQQGNPLSQFLALLHRFVEIDTTLSTQLNHESDIKSTEEKYKTSITEFMKQTTSSSHELREFRTILQILQFILSSAGYILFGNTLTTSPQTESPFRSLLISSAKVLVTTKCSEEDLLEIKQSSESLVKFALKNATLFLGPSPSETQIQQQKNHIIKSLSRIQKILANAVSYLPQPPYSNEIFNAVHIQNQIDDYLTTNIQQNSIRNPQPQNNSRTSSNQTLQSHKNNRSYYEDSKISGIFTNQDYFSSLKSNNSITNISKPIRTSQASFRQRNIQNSQEQQQKHNRPPSDTSILIEDPDSNQLIPPAQTATFIHKRSSLWYLDNNTSQTSDQEKLTSNQQYLQKPSINSTLDGITSSNSINTTQTRGICAPSSCSSLTSIACADAFAKQAAKLKLPTQNRTSKQTSCNQILVHEEYIQKSENSMTQSSTQHTKQKQQQQQQQNRPPQLQHFQSSNSLSYFPQNLSEMLTPRSPTGILTPRDPNAIDSEGFLSSRSISKHRILSAKPQQIQPKHQQPATFSQKENLFSISTPKPTSPSIQLKNQPSSTSRKKQLSTKYQSHTYNNNNPQITLSQPETNTITPCNSSRFWQEVQRASFEQQMKTQSTTFLSKPKLSFRNWLPLKESTSASQTNPPASSSLISPITPVASQIHLSTISKRDQYSLSQSQTPQPHNNQPNTQTTIRNKSSEYSLETRNASSTQTTSIQLIRRTVSQNTIPSSQTYSIQPRESPPVQHTQMKSNQLNPPLTSSEPSKPSIGIAETKLIDQQTQSLKIKVPSPSKEDNQQQQFPFRRQQRRQTFVEQMQQNFQIDDKELLKKTILDNIHFNYFTKKRIAQAATTTTITNQHTIPEQQEEIQQAHITEESPQKLQPMLSFSSSQPNKQDAAAVSLEEDDLENTLSSNNSCLHSIHSTLAVRGGASTRMAQRNPVQKSKYFANLQAKRRNQDLTSSTDEIKCNPEDNQSKQIQKEEQVQQNNECYSPDRYTKQLSNSQSWFENPREINNESQQNFTNELPRGRRATLEQPILRPKSAEKPELIPKKNTRISLHSSLLGPKQSRDTTMRSARKPIAAAVAAPYSSSSASMMSLKKITISVSRFHDQSNPQKDTPFSQQLQPTVHVQEIQQIIPSKETTPELIVYNQREWKQEQSGAISLPYWSGGSAIWKWSLLADQQILKLQLQITHSSNEILTLNIACNREKFTQDAASPHYITNNTEWPLLAEYLERHLLTVYGIRITFPPTSLPDKQFYLIQTESMSVISKKPSQAKTTVTSVPLTQADLRGINSISQITDFLVHRSNPLVMIEEKSIGKIYQIRKIEGEHEKLIPLKSKSIKKVAINLNGGFRLPGFIIKSNRSLYHVTSSIVHTSNKLSFNPIIKVEVKLILDSQKQQQCEQCVDSCEVQFRQLVSEIPTCWQDKVLKKIQTEISLSNSEKKIILFALKQGISISRDKSRDLLRVEFNPMNKQNLKNKWISESIQDYNNFETPFQILFYESNQIQQTQHPHEYLFNQCYLNAAASNQKDQSVFIPSDFFSIKQYEDTNDKLNNPACLVESLTTFDLNDYIRQHRSGSRTRFGKRELQDVNYFMRKQTLRYTFTKNSHMKITHSIKFILSRHFEDNRIRSTLTMKQFSSYAPEHLIILKSTCKKAISLFIAALTSKSTTQKATLYQLILKSQAYSPFFLRLSLQRLKLTSSSLPQTLMHLLPQPLAHLPSHEQLKILLLQLSPILERSYHHTNIRIIDKMPGIGRIIVDFHAYSRESTSSIYVCLIIRGYDERHIDEYRIVLSPADIAMLVKQKVDSDSKQSLISAARSLVRLIGFEKNFLTSRIIINSKYSNNQFQQPLSNEFKSVFTTNPNSNPHRIPSNHTHTQCFLTPRNKITKTLLHKAITLNNKYILVTIELNPALQSYQLIVYFPKSSRRLFSAISFEDLLDFDINEIVSPLINSLEPIHRLPPSQTTSRTLTKWMNRLSSFSIQQSFDENLKEISSSSFKSKLLSCFEYISSQGMRPECSEESYIFDYFLCRHLDKGSLGQDMQEDIPLISYWSAEEFEILVRVYRTTEQLDKSATPTEQVVFSKRLNLKTLLNLALAEGFFTQLATQSYSRLFLSDLHHLTSFITMKIHSFDLPEICHHLLSHREPSLDESY